MSLHTATGTGIRDDREVNGYIYVGTINEIVAALKEHESRFGICGYTISHKQKACAPTFCCIFVFMQVPVHVL